jgi:hypothetical protein
MRWDERTSTSAPPPQWNAKYRDPMDPLDNRQYIGAHGFKQFMNGGPMYPGMWNNCKVVLVVMGSGGDRFNNGRQW